MMQWISFYARNRIITPRDNRLHFTKCFALPERQLVLIEPFEGPTIPLSATKSHAKRNLLGDAAEQFEVSGNHLYRLTIRELFKMFCGIGYGGLAWKGMSDFYHPRFAFAGSNRLSLGIAWNARGDRCSGLA
jgi:hypothetical protein